MTSADAPKRFRFGGLTASVDHPCLFVAEIGSNHQGDLHIAMVMANKADKAGAHAVKIQMKTPHKLYSREMLAKPYEGPNSFGATYGAHKSALELGDSELQTLREYCDDIGILLFPTCFDEWAVDRAEKLLDPPVYKVHSGGLLDFPLLDKLVQTGKPLIISTGGHTMDQIWTCQERLIEHWLYPPYHMCFLHCTSLYPVLQWDTLRLNEITRMNQGLDTVVGWSGHDSGIAMALVAWCKGARVIEKHFTLNRAWKGTDHGFSLEPQGFAKMVRDIQRAESACSIWGSIITDGEKQTLSKMTRVVVAKDALKAGGIIDRGNLAMRVIGQVYGVLEGSEMPQLFGRMVTEAISAGEPVTLSNTKGWKD